jgi:hypothetical protein
MTAIRRPGRVSKSMASDTTDCMIENKRPYCPQRNKVESLERRISAIESSDRSAEMRIVALEVKLEKIEQSLANIAATLSKGVWLVLGAVILAIVNLVITKGS